MAEQVGDRKLIVLFTLLSVGWITVLFIESSQPPAQIIGVLPGLDKVAHFVAFGILAASICAIWFSVYGIKQIPLLSVPFLIVVLTGLVEEGYQAIVPGRAASVLDLVADVCGAVVTIFFLNRLTSA